MVKNLILFDKLHVIRPSTPENKKRDLIWRYQKYLEELAKGFPDTTMKIKEIRESDKRVVLELDGPDEMFLHNMLRKKVGTIQEFKDLRVETVHRGLMVDVSKFGFGIFADCGIQEPRTDVLLSLHELREQLCAGKKRSIREIIQGCGFEENFPVFVEITDIDFHRREASGKLASRSLNLLQKMVKEGLDGIFLSGETKGQFKKALIGKGHLRDIVSMERHAFLEHVVVLKPGTSAPGIIAEIGPELPGTSLSAMVHEKMRALRR